MPEAQITNENSSERRCVVGESRGRSTGRWGREGDANSRSGRAGFVSPGVERRDEMPMLRREDLVEVGRDVKGGSSYETCRRALCPLLSPYEARFSRPGSGLFRIRSRNVFEGANPGFVFLCPRMMPRIDVRQVEDLLRSQGNTLAYNSYKPPAVTNISRIPPHRPHATFSQSIWKSPRPVVVHPGTVCLSLGPAPPTMFQVDVAPVRHDWASRRGLKR